MIPKVLHRIWLGGDAPPVYQKFWRRWRALHPDWELRDWGNNDFGWLQNQRLFDNAHEYVAPDAVYQMKSDVARYEILREHGGLYVDADTEPLKPFDDLMGVEAFAGWEVPGKFIANGTIGIIPGHRMMERIISILPEWANNNRGKAATHVCGPRLFSRVYFDMRPNMVVHDKHVFYPYLHDDLRRGKGTVDPASVDYSSSYSVHHWNHKREIRGLVGRLSSVKGVG